MRSWGAKNASYTISWPTSCIGENLTYSLERNCLGNIVHMCFIKILFYWKDIFDTTIYFYHRGTRTNTSLFVETHFRRLLASMWTTAWPRSFFYVFAPSPLTPAGSTRWVIYMWTGEIKLESESESESDHWPRMVWRGEFYICEQGKWN